MLGAWKVPTERADAVLPRLRQVAERLGAPCAIMRDLGRAMTEAAATFVAKRKLRIPILACHMHLLRDVGSDLMRKVHDELRDRFRHFKVLPQLRSLARGLGRRLGRALPQAREGVERWIGRDDGSHRLLPDGDEGLGAVRALAQWVLDFPRDGLDQGFPFDVPMLDLFDRCLDLLAKAPCDAAVRKQAERLHRILRPVGSEVPFDRIGRVLRARRDLFHELRDASVPNLLTSRPRVPRRAHRRRSRSSRYATPSRSSPSRCESAVPRAAPPARRVAASTSSSNISTATATACGATPSVCPTAARASSPAPTTTSRASSAASSTTSAGEADAVPSPRTSSTCLPPPRSPATSCAPTTSRSSAARSQSCPPAFAKLDAEGLLHVDDDALEHDVVSRSLPAPDRHLSCAPTRCSCTSTPPPTAAPRADERRRHAPTTGPPQPSIDAKLGHISIDGTKVKANASKHKAMSYERMGETEKRLEQEVAELLARAEQADAQEDSEYGKEQVVREGHERKLASRGLEPAHEKLTQGARRLELPERPSSLASLWRMRSAADAEGWSDPGDGARPCF